MAPITKIQQIVNWLKNAEEIELAILFGSYAKGTENSQSDVDLGKLQRIRQIRWKR